MDTLPQDPILKPSEAIAFEEDYFGGNEDFQWEVINRAGEAVADSALRGYARTAHHSAPSEIIGFGGEGAIMVLIHCWRPNVFCGPYPLPGQWFGNGHLRMIAKP
jgi:hypothetical protein